MNFQNEFRFLNFQVIKRKNADELPEGQKSFVKVNLLDMQNNPCAFVIFDNTVIEKLKNSQIGSLGKIICSIDLSYSNDKWNVKLIDFSVSK